MSAFKKIRKAMITNERRVFAHIKSVGVYDWIIPPSTSWRKATERLEAKGRIKYSKRKHGYVITN